MPANHHFSDLYSQITPSSVFVIYLALVLVLFVSKALFKFCKCSCCRSMKSKVDSVQVEQRLATFFSTLKNSDRESMIREEVLD